MDHQGAGRTRRAADTRRQPPWPSMDGPGYPDGSAFPADSGFPGDPGFPDNGTTFGKAAYTKACSATS